MNTEPKPRSGMPPKTERNMLAARMRRDGFKLEDIAAMLGISRQRVHQILKREASC